LMCLDVMSIHKSTSQQLDPHKTSTKFFIHCDNLLRDTSTPLHHTNVTF
jgi:hypothetical protein